MFEQQAEELRELFKSDDEQLKEVYDDIEREQKKNADELESLRKEHNAVHLLLTSYGIPSKRNGKYLSLLERLDLALRRSA